MHRASLAADNSLVTAREIKLLSSGAFEFDILLFGSPPKGFSKLLSLW